MSEGDYRVADISLADFGRREIDIAELEVSANRWTTALQTFLMFPLSQVTRHLIDTINVLASSSPDRPS